MSVFIYYKEYIYILAEAGDSIRHFTRAYTRLILVMKKYLPKSWNFDGFINIRTVG